MYVGTYGYLVAEQEDLGEDTVIQCTSSAML